MKLPLRIIGFVWSLPIIIPTWGFYILPFWALGALRYYKTDGFPVVMFEVVPKWRWWAWLWNRPGVDTKWSGHGVPCAIVSRRKWGSLSTNRYRRLRLHEGRHVLQLLALSVLQPILYVICGLVIWRFIPEKHPYLDNPFERDARRAAGQRVDIPRSEWPK